MTRRKRIGYWRIAAWVLCVAFLFGGCRNAGNTDTQNPVENETQSGTEDVSQTEEVSQTDSNDSTESEEPSEHDTATETETEIVDLHPFDFTFCFAGDISLADDAVTTAMLEKNGNDLSKCISPELLAIMQQADVMCVNNEFTYSLRGTPMKGKAYTFRANPARVEVLKQMGVDAALLANNHVYDYGKDAFYDTLSTLEDAEIDYFGAGRNLDEAMKPIYYEVGGKTIALVAASRAEKYKLTPQATKDSPGILRCYDTELFLQVIREADEKADFVIACVHWGTEYSTVLEDVQLKTGKEYLDAGADAIIGSHSHCLQGMEFYDGKPIIYSLGNFWFNKKTLDTMLVQLRFVGNDEESEIEVSLVPALQSNHKTQILTDSEEIEKLYSRLEKISINVEIDSDGRVTEK